MLELRNVCKRFTGIVAVDDVSADAQLPESRHGSSGHLVDGWQVRQPLREIATDRRRDLRIVRGETGRGQAKRADGEREFLATP